jgi:hypothetical protein
MIPALPSFFWTNHWRQLSALKHGTVNRPQWSCIVFTTQNVLINDLNLVVSLRYSHLFLSSSVVCYIMTLGLLERKILPRCLPRTQPSTPSSKWWEEAHTTWFLLCHRFWTNHWRELLALKLGTVNRPQWSCIILTTQNVLIDELNWVCFITIFHLFLSSSVVLKGITLGPLERKILPRCLQWTQPSTPSSKCEEEAHSMIPTLPSFFEPTIGVSCCCWNSER